MGEFFKEIKTLSSFQLVCFVLFLAAIVSPGLLVIFIYKQELFLSLENFKLVLLSISISMPVLLIGTTLAMLDSDNHSWANTSFLGSFISLLISYPTLLASYLMSWSFSKFVLAYVAFIFIMLTITYIDKKVKSHNKAPKSDS